MALNDYNTEELELLLETGYDTDEEFVYQIRPDLVEARWRDAILATYDGPRFTEEDANTTVVEYFDGESMVQDTIYHEDDFDFLTEEEHKHGRLVQYETGYDLKRGRHKSG